MTEASSHSDYEPRLDYAQRRAQRAAERVKQTRSRTPLYVALGIAGVLVLLAAAEAFATVGRVHPGVTVAGVEIGGMIPEKAELVLKRELVKRAGEPVVIVHGDETWSVTADEIGLSFDHAATVDEAMAVGRDGGPFKALAGRVAAWSGEVAIDAHSAFDQEKMDKVLATVAVRTDVAPVDSTVRIDGTEPTVVSGKDGVALDKEKAARLILAASLAQDRQVDAPVGTDAIDVTDAEAEAARDVALQMLSGPVEVTYKGKAWTFESDDIAKWIAFRRSDDTSTVSGESSVPTSQGAGDGKVVLLTYVSPKAAGKSVVPVVGAKIGHPAKSARFKTSGGSVTVVPSKNGVGPDMDDLAAQLTRELADAKSQRRVELRTTITTPKLTTQQAREMGIKQRLGRFTTTYAADNASRVNNIHLLGDSLDGRLVAPGKTFSFNGAIGQRTAEKGYQEANAIVNGKLVPQLGGGICQVGTTIFNAVYESGLPITERRNHSFYISHYPKGRDATVSWGGPDFKFKNTTDDWVLVSVAYTDSSITIALYGTDPGYDVDSETSAWRNVKRYPTEEIKDPKMVVGSRVIEDPGVEGKTITVTRTVSKEGKEIRRDRFVSVYKPKVEVVRVGTKPKKKPAADATVAPPKP